MVSSSLLFFTGSLTCTHEGYEWAMGITRNGHIRFVTTPTQECDTRNSIESPYPQPGPSLIQSDVISLHPDQPTHLILCPLLIQALTMESPPHGSVAKLFFHRDLLQVNFNEAQHLEVSAGDISGRRI